MRFKFNGEVFEEGITDPGCQRSDIKAEIYNCRDDPPLVGPSQQVS